MEDFNNLVENAFDFAQKMVKKNIPEYTTMCQNHSSVNGFYPQCKNEQWTCGFWVGELWLCYERTHDEAFRRAAEVLVKSFEERIEKKIAVDHHDMGFLYSPSCVAAFKLTKDERAKKAAILAAEQLLTRWQPVGKFLQAWGKMDADDNYRYIIDCLLNTPLLYWATRETGDAKFADIARAHTATCLAHSIRADGSTYHTFFMDRKTGKALRGETCQGYSAQSFWARGQAWAVYGTALAYRYDGKAEYYDAFKRTLDFYLSKLPSDKVPYWDMIFTDENASHDGITEPRDSSSAAIVSCALLDMASQLEHLGERAEESAKYRSIAAEMMKSLIERYAVKDFSVANGLVLHGTYSKKSPFNTCTPEGVDECTSWGDYFYLEALTRLTRDDWELYW